MIGFLFGIKPAAVWRERELPQMGRWWYRRQGPLGPYLKPCMPMCVLDTFGQALEQEAAAHPSSAP